MKLKEIALLHFRGLEHFVFRPDPGLNFLIGENGVGKTSIVEAIDLVAEMRSFRSRSLGDLVRRGHLRAEVRCSIQSQEKNPIGAELKLRLECAALGQPVKKTVWINDKTCRSAGQYLNQRFGALAERFHTIPFSPADHELVSGEPALRRNYLDRAIAAQDETHLGSLQQYQRALLQRNNLLKLQTSSVELQQPFTATLCREGAQIVLKRLKWLGELSVKLPEKMTAIAPTQDVVRVCYETTTFKNENNQKKTTLYFDGQTHLPSLEQLEIRIRDALVSTAIQEQLAQVTLVGPHRDDWGFLGTNGSLKSYGSQGEVRSVLLALRLSELEMFQERTRQKPVFILDDFSSELDVRRRGYLLTYLEQLGLQVFVTSTEQTAERGKTFCLGAEAVYEPTSSK